MKHLYISGKIPDRNLIDIIKTQEESSDLIPFVKAIMANSIIETQRVEFEKLTEAIYSMALEFKFGNVTIHKQYCPMAFGNKGAIWLSDSKEIMNPYFGDKMLHCGIVKETIAQK